MKKEASKKKEDSIECVLTLVDPVWAVVPADCVTRFPGDKLPYDDPASYAVHTGSTDYLGGLTRNVEKFVIHPGWNDALAQNNIAMVKLDRPVLLQQDELATIAEPDPTKDAVQVGWGTGYQLHTSHVLQQAIEHVLPDTDPHCYIESNQFTKVATPTDQYTCLAVDPKVGEGVTSYGDNGGQQLQFDDTGKPVVIGLNEQGGVGSDVQDRPDMGAKLSHFRDWIESVICAK
jgi:hypothetical protein